MKKHLIDSVGVRLLKVSGIPHTSNMVFSALFSVAVVLFVGLTSNAQVSPPVPDTSSQQVPDYVKPNPPSNSALPQQAPVKEVLPAMQTPVPLTINQLRVRAKKNFDWQKVKPGGNFSGSFGNPTFIDVSPYVTYLVTEKFTPGVGLSYWYYSADFGSGVKYTSNVFGGRGFLRYYVLSEVFVHLELESLNIPVLGKTAADSDGRMWYTSPLVGAGYRTNADGFGFSIMALYNLNQGTNSPYASPFILRVGAALF